MNCISACAAGAGKSLCFQLPPYANWNGQGRFTVVVGPLIALMRDQVDKCLERGLDAVVFNSQSPETLRMCTLADIVADEPSTRLLYTTPESLQLPRLRDALKVRSAWPCKLALFQFVCCAC
jgi:ATP-dependent DNA helicase RecQ